MLTNIDLIDGLQGLLDDLIGDGVTPVTSFGAGNIILGGGGSDILEGRGGDDLIDGDARLNVRIAGDDVLGVSIGDNIDSMMDIQARVFAGEINPGDLHIVREILTSATEDFDTATFSNTLFDANGVANYEIRVNGLLQDLGAGPIGAPITIVDGDIVTVTTAATAPILDGTDTLRNIERLQFADQALVINGENDSPVGLLDIDAGLVDLDNNTADPGDDTAPIEDQLLTVNIAAVTDGDNVNLVTNPTGAITGPVAYFWQFEKRLDEGVFEDIVIATGLGDQRATGTTFTPGDAEAGLRLRVRAVYQDANGVLETVFSAPTAAVPNVNDAAGRHGADRRHHADRDPDADGGQRLRRCRWSHRRGVHLPVGAGKRRRCRRRSGRLHADRRRNCVRPLRPLRLRSISSCGWW